MCKYDDAAQRFLHTDKGEYNTSMFAQEEKRTYKTVLLHYEGIAVVPVIASATKAIKP